MTVSLDFRAFAYYHPAYRQWITEDGEFDILIGASSTDIRHSMTAMLHSTLELPSILNRESTLREWTEDPRGMSVLAPFLQQMIDQMRATIGGSDSEAIGMDPMGFLMDTPLMGLFHFLGSSTQTSPEEMVDGFLAKVYSIA